MSSGDKVDTVVPDQQQKRQENCDQLRGSSMEKSAVVNTEEGRMDPPSSEGHDSVSSQAVCQFYLQGKCRFGDKCRNFHAPKDENSSKSDCDGVQMGSSNCTTNNEGSAAEILATAESANSQKNSNSDSKRKKKVPMRTAADVISRMKWDPAFEGKLCFVTVGYLDRFYGTLERPFDSFNWDDDLASVGESDLAIPQHRISYFKYRETKIWDKESRLDMVFNSSAESPDSTKEPQKSLEELLENLDKEFYSKVKSAVANIGEGNGANVREEDGWDDEDEDDDDGANITTGTGYGAAFREQHINSCKMEDRSTHFLAIKITNKDIVRKAQEVQENAIGLEPILRDCCMREGLFHITFCMLRLEGQSSCHNARKLLEESTNELREIVSQSPDSIQIRGLKTFGNRVLYAGVVPPLNFWSIEAHLRNKFTRPDLGIKLTSHFEFVPHMTIMKVSRPIARERNTKYIDPGLYIKFVDQDFGSQPIDNINLCIIEDTTRYDGFYQTLCDVQLL